MINLFQAREQQIAREQEANLKLDIQPQPDNEIIKVLESTDDNKSEEASNVELEDSSKQLSQLRADPLYKDEDNESGISSLSQNQLTSKPSSEDGNNVTVEKEELVKSKSPSERMAKKSVFTIAYEDMNNKAIIRPSSAEVLLD